MFNPVAMFIGMTVLLWMAGTRAMVNVTPKGMEGIFGQRADLVVVIVMFLIAAYLGFGLHHYRVF